MLAGQAVYASALFLDKKVSEIFIDKAFRDVERKMENIVLIGMPSSGKSTVGRQLAKILNREFFDSDEQIISAIGMPIAEYFERYGESSFRAVEQEIIARISEKRGCIIATGGGTVLKRENVLHLKQNGRIFFLDRSLEKLISTSDRPLSSNPQTLKLRYIERYPIYSGVCDVKINGDGSVEETAEEIIENIK